MMHIRLTFLFLLLATVTSLSHAIDYVYTHNGSLRFYWDRQGRNELCISKRDDKEWIWFYSLPMPYSTGPEPRWRQEYDSDGHVRSYIELPNGFEKDSPAYDRRFIMIERTDGDSRVYRIAQSLQLDMFNLDSNRFDPESSIDSQVISYFHFLHTICGYNSELLLDLYPGYGVWIPIIYLLKSDAEFF